MKQAARDEWKALTEAGNSLQDARPHFIQLWKTASGEEALTLMVRTMPKFGPQLEAEATGTAEEHGDNAGGFARK